MAVPRSIERVVPCSSGHVNRLIGTVDVDGQGTTHSLVDCNPCMLLDQATLTKTNMPPFGAHPHRGHSVVTVLMQGSMTSWDSFTNSRSTITGPSAYWVNAGSGVFHDEVTVIEDESDSQQHVSLFQLWVGVKEEDRQKPATLSWDKNLPVQKLIENEDEIGSIIRYVGGASSTLDIPRPLTVAQTCQRPGTICKFPIPTDHTGFIVNLSGASYVDSESKPASFGGTTPSQVNDALVLSKEGDHIEIVADKSHPTDYLICVGEPHGEAWSKKLVASGAVIAKSTEEARAIAKDVEKMSKRGKETGDFSPFGEKPMNDK